MSIDSLIITGAFVVGVIIFQYFTRRNKKDILGQTKTRYEHDIEVLNQQISMLKRNTVDFTTVIPKNLHEKILLEKDSDIQYLAKQCESLHVDRDNYKSKYETINSSRKSSEVRLGQITENIVPFLNGFKYDPKSVRFLGSPIDLIAFEQEEIVFIEVKTGKSKLSAKQRNIRDLVDSGKVRFETHRINEGYEVD